MTDAERLIRLTELTGIKLHSVREAAGLGRRTVDKVNQGNPVSDETIAALTAAVVAQAGRNIAHHAEMRDVVLMQTGIDIDVPAS